MARRLETYGVKAFTHNPKRIALLGYGEYGKHLHAVILKHWPRQYVVTMAFDAHVDGPGAICPNGQTPLKSPDALAAAFHEGAFDAVLVSIPSREDLEQAWSDLDNQGIPRITLVSEDDFRHFEAFENTASRALAPGYELHRYSSVYGISTHGPFIQQLLYLFDDRGFALYDNWYRDDFKYDPFAANPTMPFAVPEGGVVGLRGEYCAVARMWATNYGHIIYQMLSQIALMEANGYQGTYLMVRSSAAEQLLDLMGIDSERITWLDELEQGTVYRFEEMLIASHWEFHHATVADPAVKAARTVENEVLRRCGGGCLEGYPRRLFIKRIGSRRLLDVEGILERYGFQTIIPEELSVEEQIRHFHAAQVVLSPHGANSTNSIFMRPNTAFIETFGSGLVAPWCHDVLRIKGVRYFPVPETPIYPSTTREVNRDYAVHPAILESIIESAIDLTKDTT